MFKRLISTKSCKYQEFSDVLFHKRNPCNIPTKKESFEIYSFFYHFLLFHLKSIKYRDIPLRRYWSTIDFLFVLFDKFIWILKFHQFQIKNPFFLKLFFITFKFISFELDYNSSTLVAVNHTLKELFKT